MSSDSVRKITLGELGDFKNGANFSQDDYGPGFPIINVKQLYGGRYVDLHNLESLGREVLRRPEQLFVEEGDILFARSSVKRSGAGQCALVPANVFQTVFSGFIIRYRLNDKLSTNPMYLSYLLQSPIYREVFPRIATGTTISNLSQDALKAVEVLLPSKLIQDEVAIILGRLDDRITLLRETNATLEAIAQALFKSWFVDFDPVRAKAEGRQPEGMDAITAALFPDSFEESELGLVPKGWEIRNLSDICTIASGKRPPDRSDSSTEVCSVPLYGGAGLMGYTSASLFDEAQIVTGRVGTLGKVHIAYPPFWASDNVLVVSPKLPADFSFALNWIRSIDVQALNRGSTQPLLTQRDLGAQQGMIPSREVLHKFEEIVGRLYDRIRSQEQQAQTLTQLRDTLLPRLISGQLRLPETEPAIEAALA